MSLDVMSRIMHGGYKEPNVAINSNILYQTGGPFSQVSNASNNPWLTAYDVSYTIPSWWTTKNFTVFGTITSTANNCCICYLTQVFINGVQVTQAGSSRNGSNVFTTSSGTIDIIGNYGNDGGLYGSTTFSLKASDVVRLVVLYVARNVSGTASASNITVGIKRSS